MTMVPYRVRSRAVENDESTTLCLQPIDERLPVPEPGQFVMLYAFGVGEIAMSFSGDPSATDGAVSHTIRCVGAVSRALRDAAVGTVVGIRGPFGTGWELSSAAGQDVVIVGGGCGLAPLRPLVLAALADRDRYRRVVLIAGARTPRQLLYRSELQRWAADARLEVHTTVDSAEPGWPGEVGVVTEPLRRLALAPARTTAFLCGPETMIRFAARTLLEHGLAAHAIRVSLERNMQCGIGWCGHCQLGPLLLCRDGPVVGYDVARPLLEVEEL